MKSILLKGVPHLIAILSFIVISSIFYSPAVAGKKLVAGDTNQWKGMSKELLDHYKTTGEDAMWTGSMFSGMPSDQILVMNRGNIISQLDNVYKLWLPRPIDILFKAMLGFYILLMCLRINPVVGAAAAISFGLSSIFILYIGAGHASKMISLGYIAPMLGGVIYAFRKNAWKGALITALFLALQIGANHLQMTYYAFILLLIVGVGEVIKLTMEKKLKSLPRIAGFLVLAGILGVLPNYGSLTSTAEYGKYSTRGETELTLKANENTSMQTTTAEGLAKDYILEYSMANGEWFSAYVPNVKGGATDLLMNNEEAKKAVKSAQMRQALSQNRIYSYWGEQGYTKGAFYFGALMFFLAICCITTIKDPLSYSLLAVAIISILASWKLGWIPEFFIEKIPLWNKFRDTKMMLVLLMLIVPLLGAIFLDKFLGDKEFRVNKKILFAGTAGGFLLLNIILLASPGSIFSFFSSAESLAFKDAGKSAEGKQFLAEVIKGRHAIFNADLIRSLGVFILGALILSVAIFKSQFIKYLSFALAIVFIGDMWSVSSRYTKDDSYEDISDSAIPFAAGEAEKNILTIEKENIPGFDKKLTEVTQVYQDATGDNKNTKKNLLQRELETLMQNSNYRVLNIVNPFSDARTSFYHKSIGGYHGAKLKNYQELSEFYLTPEINEMRADLQANKLPAGDYKFLNMLNTKYFIYSPDAPPIPNSGAMGNAWLVNELEVVKSADDEMTALKNLAIASTAVIQEKFAEGIKTSFSSDGKITMTDYKPNQISYSVTTNQDVYAVFSEIYYPVSWNAYADGTKVEHQKVNYALRGLSIPAGTKEVVFKYEPATFITGKTISKVSSLILLVLGALGLFLSFKNSRFASSSLLEE